MIVGCIPQTAKWIGFDLDDTLHFYRKAAGRASGAVFEYLSKEFGCRPAELQSAYGEILKEAQSGSFAEGKTATEYRAERFGKLLADFSIIHNGHLDTVLNVYDETLHSNFELKEGAQRALSAAKASGLRVMVVSEGPHDAQETTIRSLGISPYVDLLVTSAGEKTSKRDGLLKKALDKAKCSPDELVYIGDDIEGDILPARLLGVRSFYVGDQGPAPDDVPRITLVELSELLSGFSCI